MIKDTYKGNAEAILIETSEMVENIKRSIRLKTMSEAKLLELLNVIHKDLEKSLHYISLC
jgi:predicted metal-dependent hydrolase